MGSYFDIERAKAAMKRLGYTYAAVARELGYERQAVGHWFRVTVRRLAVTRC